MDFTLLRLLIRQPKRRKQPERYAKSRPARLINNFIMNLKIYVSKNILLFCILRIDFIIVFMI
jgi:hypothetical protein